MLMPTTDDTSYAHYSPTINILFVSTQLGYLSYRYPVAATAAAPKVSAAEAAGELNIRGISYRFSPESYNM